MGFAIDKKFYDEHRSKMVDYIAEHDDELVDKYLNGVARRWTDDASPSGNRRWR